MDIQTLKAGPRKSAGSRAAERLRRQGKLPAVVYGHKRDPEPVALTYHDVEMQLHHGVHLVNLDVDGKVQPCLFKEVQYDHLGAKMIHVDLARVDLNERVKVKVHLELRGTPKGVAEGGVLRQELADLEIECLVTSIPENIRINVADMELDAVMYVKDLKLDPGVTAMNDPETVVCACRIPHVKVEAPPAEAAAAAAASPTEPEVIAKGKIEEEGAEATEKEKGKEKGKEKEK